MKKKKRHNLTAFDYINTVFLGLIALLALIPFYMVIITSFASEKSILMNGYTLWPKEFSLNAYSYVLSPNSSIYNGYLVTVTITVVGTVLGVLVTSLFAYVCAQRQLRYRGILSMIAYIPIVFNGGMVAFYMVLVSLHLQNTLLGLIVPMLMAPMNVFLMKNYFMGLPESIKESARIDGASEFRIYRSVIMPISTPVIATVGLFVALQYWNEWFLPLLIINDEKLYPLQFLLRQIMARVSYVSTTGMTTGTMPQESLKMATVVVTIGPIVLLYPFVQKYFVKGITIGSVKG